MAAITVIDLQKHLGLDVIDAQIEANLENAVNAANRLLIGGINKDIDDTDPRAKELALKKAADLYENRGISGAANNTRNRCERDMAMQLWVEGLEKCGEENG